jgi:hypothetical protein
MTFPLALAALPPSMLPDRSSLGGGHAVLLSYPPIGLQTVDHPLLEQPLGRGRMLPKCLDKPIAAVIADPVVDNRFLHARRFHDLRTNQVAVSVAAHVATHTTAPRRLIATVYLAS